MNQQHEHLATLQEIRNIMDRSSRFISLSGLAGVFAGIFALAGAAVVKWYLSTHNIKYRTAIASGLNTEVIIFLVSVALLVMVLAIAAAIYFTTRKARQQKQPVWDTKVQRLLLNLAIPLGVGGLFCAVLLYHGIIYLVAPAMLVFYGLALINGSKYTLSDIRYLGLCEIALGLVACFFIGYGLLSWTIGFGVLHILYGTIMYFKYERHLS
ncbi:hypothetical protein FVR03_00885 [Pontibacter qinzhouensis]|uniref:Uncharacterized protein n=1 Tax=Pontibacter qinzhouensis TaxID=2603253 RepID=A0A5C8KFW2_9BACT|nr:hypothetical protein [Pontibacter qinzhouensis]TXK52644.1 hypothetical protein FVR03_00885 [Pontibacter qinzhouensis]